jgi:hypothetical protein
MPDQRDSARVLPSSQQLRMSCLQASLPNKRPQLILPPGRGGHAEATTFKPKPPSSNEWMVIGGLGRFDIAFGPQGQRTLVLAFLL